MNEPSALRERIIEEATRLFVARGYDGISMREIAEMVNVSKAGIYYYFKGKEDLFIAVLRANLDLISTIMSDARRQGVTAREQAALMLRGIAAQTPEQRSIIRLASHDMGRVSPDARAAFNQIYQQAFIGQIEGILNAGVNRGELKPVDVRLATWILLGMAYPFFTSAQEHKADDTARAVNLILDIFFDGIAV